MERFVTLWIQGGGTAVVRIGAIAVIKRSGPDGCWLSVLGHEDESGSDALYVPMPLGDVMRLIDEAQL